MSYKEILYYSLEHEEDFLEKGEDVAPYIGHVRFFLLLCTIPSTCYTIGILIYNNGEQEVVTYRTSSSEVVS